MTEPSLPAAQSDIGKLIARLEIVERDLRQREPLKLGDLADVRVAGVVDTNSLVFDETRKLWIPGSPPDIDTGGGGGGSFTENNKLTTVAQTQTLPPGSTGGSPGTFDTAWHTGDVSPDGNIVVGGTGDKVISITNPGMYAVSFVAELIIPSGPDSALFFLGGSVQGWSDIRSVDVPDPFVSPSASLGGTFYTPVSATLVATAYVWGQSCDIGPIKTKMTIQQIG